MQFDPDIARRVGVEEAIMYSNLQFWCVHNKANGQHFYENRYWTYNSYGAFCELFPFWTEKQIRRILKKLETTGLVKTSNFNRRKYDKTKWYSTDCPNGQMDMTEPADASAQTGGPIPDNKLQIVNSDVPHGTIPDTDRLLNGIKAIVGIIDGSLAEQQRLARDFLKIKTPEILRSMGNLAPSREQIVSATLRIFQLARQDRFHSMNCTSMRYVYSRAGAIVMSAQAAQPRIAVIS